MRFPVWQAKAVIAGEENWRLNIGVSNPGKHAIFWLLLQWQSQWLRQHL